MWNLKGHGNEADFLGFLQKLVPHRSLPLPFEPFHFRLRIRGDIQNRKTTPRLGESGSRHGESGSRHGESGSRHGESGSRYLNFLKFCIDFPNFKWLNQPFKRSIWQKKKPGTFCTFTVDLFKGLKKIVYRHSCRLPDSASQGVVFRL
jgi:hypothetical protein